MKLPNTLAAVVVSVVALAFTAPGHAQSSAGLPPVFPAIDANSVNVATGEFHHSRTDVVIGQPGAGGLTYTRYYQSGQAPPGQGAFWTHNHNGYIAVADGALTCSVVIGTTTETFTASQSLCTGTFTSNQQRGATLTLSSPGPTGIYTFTASNGTVAQFQRKDYTAVYGMPSYQGRLISITTAEGEVTNYGYDVVFSCSPSPEECTFQNPIGRLTTVTNNFGYALYFRYPEPDEEFLPVEEVIGINQSVEGCFSNCSLPWPYATYTYNGWGYPETATNDSNGTTTYAYSGPVMTEIQFADHADHDINIAYSGGRVQSVDQGFGTWSYSYADAGGQRTTTVTNPDTTARVYVSSINTGRINSVSNELNQTLSYAYDAWARQTRVTQPEGNYTEYTHDGRGNITETRHVSKSPGTPADIVTSAIYPFSCSNVRTCNKPTSTTDARGYRTDYTYDAAHGGVLTITAPAPSGPTPVGSGTRPQTRFGYAQFQARYASGGTAGPPVWRLTATSACATGAAPGCLGTADETITTVSYPTSATPNNVLPFSTTSGAGNAAVSATTAMTYTAWGDVLTVDGPLPGAADTSRFYYDAGRRPVGAVGPDPDGGGPLLHRARRITYTAIGQPTLVEQGTVTNQSDAEMSTFTALEKQDTGYDSFARPVISRMWNGVSIVALTQASYDNRGRPLCNVARMNSGLFASPPADACTLGSSGTFGPDRITHNTYDVVGRVSSMQSAYGTALAQSTAAYTYTVNGQVATLTDARNSRTTYEYDAFDRLVKRRYPHPSNPNESSTSDFEEFTYNAFGQLAQERRRGGSGDPFDLSYDNLGRVTSRAAPGVQPDVSYEYDLLNRTTVESQTGNTLTTYYNALSRVTSVQSSVFGTVTYETDEAGRRTRMDYPGASSFYVTYSHNTAGDLTGILENGSASLAAYSYDNLGRRTSLARGTGANAVVTNYTFDSVSRLASLTQDPPSTAHDATFAFNYNPASQITSRTRTNAVYDYVLPASSSQSYTSDGLNRYTSALGVMPSYDARGNLIGDGTKNYGYDFDNRVTSASGGVTLSYDPSGRLQEVAGASTTRFLYDGAHVIAEYNAGGTVLRRYVHGPGSDEPLAWYEGSGTGDRRWLIADERGSVIGTANNSGAVTQVNKYDLYGVPDAANQGRFQYTGQMWIAELGLYHYKARAYHPRLGRFMQTDPIGYSGGMNLYGYVGNDPANLRDPTGLTKEVVPGDPHVYDGIDDTGGGDDPGPNTGLETVPQDANVEDSGNGNLMGQQSTGDPVIDDSGASCWNASFGFSGALHLAYRDGGRFGTGGSGGLQFLGFSYGGSYLDSRFFMQASANGFVAAAGEFIGVGGSLQGGPGAVPLGFNTTPTTLHIEGNIGNGWSAGVSGDFSVEDGSLVSVGSSPIGKVFGRLGVGYGAAVGVGPGTASTWGAPSYREILNWASDKLGVPLPGSGTPKSCTP